jgi:RNA polymerase sigma-70 factor (ECF subfamily)
MIVMMSDCDSEQTQQMLDRASVGDRGAWDQLLGRYHQRLRRMVVSKLNRRLLGRFDPSDVLQEAYLDACDRLTSDADRPKLPFFLWLRLLVAHHVGRLHRDNLGRKRRDPRREISLDRAGRTTVSSRNLANQLADTCERASEHAVKAERQQLLRDAVARMEPLDREILSLRHFEQQTRAESAQTLGISEAAAAKRYLRALERLRESLATEPGGLEDL